VPKRIRRRGDTDPREGIKKYGKATFADPINNKYPIDTPGRIKAAWAYVHQPSNAEKYSDEELRTIKVRIRRAAKARQVMWGREGSRGRSTAQPASSMVQKNPSIGCALSQSPLS